MPEQKRVYTARFEADISTRFEDWIERNLLEVERDQVNHIVLNEYTVDEGHWRRASAPSEFTLDKVDDTTWNGSGVPEDQEVDFVEVNRLVGAVIGLRIAGVRPKPAGMTGNLRDAAMAGRIGQADIIDLINKGFYPTAEGGLLSNEGELLVRTTEGVLYTLRFGEIVYGRGDAILLGSDRKRRRGGRTRREPLRLHHRGVRRGGPARTECCGHRRPCVVGTPGRRRPREGRAPRRAVLALVLRRRGQQLRPHPQAARGLPERPGGSGRRRIGFGGHSTCRPSLFRRQPLRSPRAESDAPARRCPRRLSLEKRRPAHPPGVRAAVRDTAPTSRRQS